MLSPNSTKVGFFGSDVSSIYCSVVQYDDLVEIYKNCLLLNMSNRGGRNFQLSNFNNNIPK